MKKLLSLLLVAVFMFSVVACGGDSQTVLEDEGVAADYVAENSEDIAVSIEKIFGADAYDISISAKDNTIEIVLVSNYYNKLNSMAVKAVADSLEFNLKHINSEKIRGVLEAAQEQVPELEAVVLVFLQTDKTPIFEYVID